MARARIIFRGTAGNSGDFGSGRGRNELIALVEGNPRQLWTGWRAGFERRDTTRRPPAAAASLPARRVVTDGESDDNNDKSDDDDSRNPQRYLNAPDGGATGGIRGPLLPDDENNESGDEDESNCSRCIDYGSSSRGRHQRWCAFNAFLQLPTKAH